MRIDPFIAFTQKYLSQHKEALYWVVSYVCFCHAVDDLIDGDKTDSDFILKVFEFAALVYSYPFYIQHINTLYPLTRMAHNSYADSISMEKKIDWRKNYGDVLRQNGNEVILAVIELVSDYDTKRKASLELREIAYKAHHKEDGTPC